MTERWRILQDGMAVASSEGPADRARADIGHYAMVYGQDGPVVIEQRLKGRWKAAAPEPLI